MDPLRQKPVANLVVIGHVDSGKSTTTGHLLYKVGAIDKRKIEKFEKESKQMNKGSFKFAWMLDDLKAERDRGITIDIKSVHFQTKKFQFTIIDAPGHRDFIKNMIVGASQADVAILVISASQGEFEAGFATEGQSREHALLAYTLGVRNLIVAVNKMDSSSVLWSEDRYNEVKSRVGEMLGNIGFDVDKVPFVPISGWSGSNLTTRETKMRWYEGPLLLEALNSIQPPRRLEDKPLRFPVQNAYKVSGVGSVLVGRVECGVIRHGQQAVIAPNKLEVKVSSLEVNEISEEEAGAGQNVAINIKGDFKHRNLSRGMVVGDAKEDPPQPVKSFEAHVIVVQHPSDISAGYTPVVDCHTSHTACEFVELMSKVDKRTGTITEDAPKYIRKGDAAFVRMVPKKPVCLESHENYPPLARFACRDMKRTVAVGVIKKVENGDLEDEVEA